MGGAQLVAGMGGAGSGGTDTAPGTSATGATGMGGEESNPDCFPIADCRGDRAYWLLIHLLGRQVDATHSPELAECVDYNQNGWINIYDYRILIQEWSQGCQQLGAGAPSGACLFAGDVDGNDCLDWNDYDTIEAELGSDANQATPCADVDDDGFITELDLAHLLGNLHRIGCTDLELDPALVLGSRAGSAQACGAESVGDVNQNGKIDFYDLSGVLSHFGHKSTDTSKCLDLNRDGAIDLHDALHVLKVSWEGTNVLECQERLTKLQEFVQTHRSCDVDADCTAMSALCAPIFDHCSRVLYLNQATDDLVLSNLVKDTETCTTDPACHSCDHAPPTPRCIAGRCQPSP
jgi:Ca2+-binding EF-hand superfamily protein